MTNPCPSTVARVVWRAGACVLAPVLLPTLLVVAGVAGAGDEAAVPAVRKGTATAATLNVRARPGTMYEVVAKLTQGAPVEIVGEQEGWYEIRPPADTEAWVAMRYLDVQGKVTGDEVYVRSGPGAIFSAFGKLTTGEVVERVGAPADEWQRIEAPPQATVWVSSQFIKVEPPPPPPPPPPVVTPPAPAPVAESAKPLPPTPAPPVFQPQPRPVQPPASVVRPKETPVKPEIAKAPPPKGPIMVDDRFIEYLDEPSPDVFAFVPPVGDRTPAGDAETARAAKDSDPSVTFTGVVIPLKEKKNAFATHVLARLDGRKAIPHCYLRTRLFALDDWNYHEVRVYGKRIDYPGWKWPVIELNGIQLANPQ